MEEIKRININGVSNRIVLTRSIYLRFLSLIYLIAFVGIYGQIQGLWGEEGLLPLNLFLNKLRETYKTKANFLNFPILAWFFEYNFINLNFFEKFGIYLNSNLEIYMYILCLIGIFISFSILCNFKYFFNNIGFALMWYCYYNFFVIGQQFIKYEWDMLLLETGFITIFFAPNLYKNINLITFNNNISFYLLRFILFKILYCTGINLITSECPYWLSFNGLNFFFQNQHLLSGFSYVGYLLDERFKKAITAFIYFFLFYIPFGYFLIWRRFNIFCGQITIIFNLMIMFVGNYSFLNPLILTLNILNFDDYFIRGIFSQNFLDFFNVDTLIPIIYKYVEEKREKEKKDQEEQEKLEKLKKEIEEKMKKNETEEDKKRIREIYDEIGKKNFNWYEYSDYARIEETVIPTTSLTTELIIFINVFCAMNLFIFLYFFPLKKLLSGNTVIKSFSLNNVKSFNDIYMIYIYIYLLFIIFYNIAIFIKNSFMNDFNPFEDSEINNILKSKEDKKEEEEKKLNENSPKIEEKKDENNKIPKISEKKIKKLRTRIFKKILKGFFYSTNFCKYLLIIILFTLYFLGSIKTMYTSLNVELIEKEENIEKNNNAQKEKNYDLEEPSSGLISMGVVLSDLIFQRFLPFGLYGNIQKEIIGITGRQELEIEFIEKSGQKNWELINFMYKINHKNFPKFLFFYLPRIDWEMSNAAVAPDINSESWLIVLIGRIFEKNPVILDLLGYKIDEKNFYYKLSFFEKIKCYYLNFYKEEFDYNPKKIKIDVFKYNYLRKPTKLSLFKRKRHQEFLGSVEKSGLNRVFEKFNLPRIDENRKKHINSFQLIPVIDILVILLLVKNLFF